MRSFFFRLKALLRRRDKEAELQEELQFHIDEEADENAARGMTGEAAQRAARRDLGNMALLQEDTRAVWTWRWLEELVKDLRYAIRAMTANQTFYMLAILSLALGIGANTAIFSFMDAILLRSLPVSDPQSLVLLNWHTQHRERHGLSFHNDYYGDTGAGYTGGTFAYPAFEMLQKTDSVFSSVFGHQGAGVLNMAMSGQADLARGEYVTGEYFYGLGGSPAAGRLIVGDDDLAGAPAVAAISYAWSRKHFGDPVSALGRSILVNKIPFTVVGVTPPEFFGTDPDSVPDIYIPLHTNLMLEAGNPYSPAAGRYLDANFEWVEVMARLRPSITAAQAQASLGPRFVEWERLATSKRPRTDLPNLVVEQGGSGLGGLRGQYGKPLYILLTLSLLILIIACANIANLLLARASARRREIAVRLSLGAGRLRLIRQLLTESVLVSCLGGALGVGFAVWGIRFLTLLLANGRENFSFRAELNWPVLTATAALSLLTGILFGLVPAIQATRVNLAGSLRDSKIGRRRMSFFRSLTLGRALIVSQIAISLLILVSAGLFLRTLSHRQSIPLGFNSENVLTFALDARQAGHRDPEIIHFYNDLRAAFAGIPGVRSASLSFLPLIGKGAASDMVSVEGNRPDEKKSSSVLTVGPEFFVTMQISILLGRQIGEADLPDSPAVAVVNQAFVRNRFGSENPIGRRLTFPGGCAKCNPEIVGVSADALYGDLKEQVPPAVYVPFTQGGRVEEMTFELLISGNPAGIIDAVRETVRKADDHLPLSEMKSQSEWIDRTISREIAFARLCTAFGILALAIACVGLYGSVSYNVARRTNEIGLRMALGAPRNGILWMVLGEVLLLVAIGLAISIPAAFAGSTLVESFLFGVKPNDVPALAGAMVVLVAASLLAGYLPARSASRTDPMIALRHE